MRKRRGKIKDETGKIYGRLRVLKYSHSNHRGLAHWTVYCDPDLGCTAGGKEFTIAGSSLRSGLTESCGCLRKGMGRIDETGNVYGRLRVIRYSHVNRDGKACWVVYCDPALGCTEGGKEFTTTGKVLRNGDSRSCGCWQKEQASALGEKHPSFGRKGEKAIRWQGGKTYGESGRVLIYVPSHPFPSKKPHYVFRYRLVMEEHLGRFLEPEEVAHHIDGDPTNDAIENLMLFPNNAAHTRWHKQMRDKEREVRNGK